MAAEASSEMDLARLKALAEEGRNRPLLGGRHFILFGAALALASLMHAAILARVLPWPPIAFAAVWLVWMGGASVAARIIPKGASSGTIGNRVERQVWNVGGVVLAALALGILAHAMLAMGRTESAEGFRLFVLLPPVTFGVYAIAMAASAAAAQADHLRPYAVMSVVFLVLTVMLAGSIWQYLAMAAGAVLVSVVPGFVLLRREAGHG